jgi:hypothetical protein
MTKKQMLLVKHITKKRVKVARRRGGGGERPLEPLVYAPPAAVL